MVTVEEHLDVLVEYETNLKEQTRLDAVPTAFYSTGTRRGGKNGGGQSHGGCGLHSSRGGNQGFSRPQQQHYNLQQPIYNCGLEPYNQPTRRTPSMPVGPSSSAKPSSSRWASVIYQFCDRPGHSSKTMF
ncbi:unnamed protein product [Linum trigynum]|uniref:Uncharacterized protein n=1 Tax=Linum trigynum TaxID=586398 RepID=A0AAV2DA28_9ROSI